MEKKLRGLFVVILLLCCMGTDDCVRDDQIAWSKKIMPDAVYVADPTTDLCFAVFPNGHASWGTTVPCTDKVCSKIQGEKPEACRPIHNRLCN